MTPAELRDAAAVRRRLAERCESMSGRAPSMAAAMHRAAEAELLLRAELALLEAERSDLDEADA